MPLGVGGDAPVVEPYDENWKRTRVTTPAGDHRFARAKAVPEETQERSQSQECDGLREVREREERGRPSHAARREPLSIQKQARGRVESGRQEKDHRAIGHERSPVINAPGKDCVEEARDKAGQAAAKKPTRKNGNHGNRAETERQRNQASEDLVNAEDLVERRGKEGHDLQLELDVVGRRPVVRGLWIHDIELPQREVPSDCGGIALAPTRVIHDRVANAVESQRQRDR